MNEDTEDGPTQEEIKTEERRRFELQNEELRREYEPIAQQMREALNLEPIRDGQPDYLFLSDQLIGPNAPEVHHTACFYCNGYYGPCFGEPVCGTCHDFLYTEDDVVTLMYPRASEDSEREPVAHPGASHAVSDSAEQDDADSGNDEPSEQDGIAVGAGAAPAAVRGPGQVQPSRSQSDPALVMDVNVAVGDENQANEQEEEAQVAQGVEADAAEAVQEHLMVPEQVVVVEEQITPESEDSENIPQAPVIENNEVELLDEARGGDEAVVVADEVAGAAPAAAIPNDENPQDFKYDTHTIPYDLPAAAYHNSNWVTYPKRSSEKITNRLAQLTTPWHEHEGAAPVGNDTDDLAVGVPPEIWAIIFKKMDDMSLMMSSKVSRKWKAIIRCQFPNEKWAEFVKKRWPLFQPIYAPGNTVPNASSPAEAGSSNSPTSSQSKPSENPERSPVDKIDWYSVYNDFVDSLPCRLCFMNLISIVPVGPGITSMSSPVLPSSSGGAGSGFIQYFNEGHNYPLRFVRLQKELKWLRMDHPEGIEAIPLDKLNYNWLARVHGPSQSPYQGGVFYLNLKLPHDYPLKPPMVRFLTKIFHPNISRHGDISIDCIQHNWTLALTIPQVLLSVQSLLTDPYLETNMEPAIANLYKNNRKAFDRIARIWTWRFAFIDVLVH